MKTLRRRRASSLVITLLVLVVLSTIVVAFMQSMSIERMTARSVANSYQAQLAAEAGFSVALKRLSDSATTNYAVAYDKRITDPLERPLVFISLDANGQPTATNSINMTNGPAIPGTNHTFQLGPNYVKRANLFVLTNASGQTNGVYSFVVQDNGSKQSLLRYPSISPRAFATTLREVPLITESNGVLPPVVTNALYTIASNSPFWYTNLLTPASFNQIIGTNLNINEKLTDTLNWSALDNRQGGQKINIRKFKFYLDNSRGNGQGVNNPKAAVVEALLGQPSSVSETAWGGGNLMWLISTRNPARYTLTEARQIAADLIDYLDEDLHPTTDNIDAPTYLGVEGRLESNGKITGHPYINSVATGLIFTFNDSGMFNSSRMVCALGLVNPWSTNSLDMTGGSQYGIELTLGVEGTATGGTLGSEAQKYFGTVLNEQLTSVPSGLVQNRYIGPNTGVVFPQPVSGVLNYANFFSLYEQGVQQPPGMVFGDMKVVVKRARLLFKSTGGQTSYVQVLDSLAGIPVPLEPSTVALPGGGPRGSLTCKFTQVAQRRKRDFHLSGDPRLNFQTNAWILSESTEASGTPPPPPVPSTALNIASQMSASEGDGLQGMPTGATAWYRSAATTNHFFVRSTPAISPKQGVPGEPADFDPAKAPTGLAIDSIGELGYLFTGRPWQTVSVATTNSSVGRKDYQLLDFVDAGTMQTNNLGGARVNGKININTASPQTLRGMFTDIPGMTEPVLLGLIDAIATNSINSVDYPFIGSVDVGAVTNLTLGLANKFQRENLVRRIANLTTTKSDNFTIYSYGEAKQGQKTVARANLVAEVQLIEDGSGNVSLKVLRKTWK